MLAHISIRNFVLVDQLSLDFTHGMNVITGETGTGKSILLNALALTLGERGSPSLVRKGSKQADISTIFNISKLPQATEWLDNKELSSGEECILRRTLAQEGASRAFINGTPVTLEAIRELSHLLVSVQGQHAHQTLLQPNSHLKLLDDFGSLSEQTRAYSHSYEELLAVRQELQDCYQKEALDEHTLTLLKHELAELEELALTEKEYQQLEEEHSRLNNVESLLETTQNALQLLNSDVDQPAISSQTGQLLSLLQQSGDKRLEEMAQSLMDADAILHEVQSQLRSYMDGLVADPERFSLLNDRLVALHNLARKHRVEPQALKSLATKRKKDLEERTHIEEKLSLLTQKEKELLKQCVAKAAILTTKRKKVAQTFDEEVMEQLARLQMPCRFATQFTKKKDINMQGDSQVEFMLATSSETALLPLRRIASGGELSRAALGIHLVGAKHSAVPCLVFDEVDSGIGGRIAAKVGRALATLGKDAQLICITHQPQVAVFGDSHYLVTKAEQGSSIKSLTQAERQQEIGRMVGGEKLSDEALSYASALIKEANMKETAMKEAGIKEASMKETNQAIETEKDEKDSS